MFSRVRFLWLIVVLAGGITSCAAPSHSQRPQNYALKLPVDFHLTYSGRGAASGPMLMGAMGPAGIAVGMAIDVGIGKDIEKSGFAGGLDVPVLFATAVAEVKTSSTTGKAFFATKNAPQFSLEKFGFKDLPGQSDFIVAQLELKVERGTWQKTYYYPLDFMATIKPPASGASLELLKSSASPASNILLSATALVLEQAAADWALASHARALKK